MENAVVSSVLRDAAVARVTQRGALKAGSLFGLGLVATGFAALLVAILIAGADPSGLSFIVPMIVIVAGLTYAVARHGRWAQALAAVASLALIGMLIPIVGHAAFDSFFDFVPVALCLTGAVTVIGFAGADLARRELSPNAAPALKYAAVVVVAIIGAAGFVSAIATFAGQETLSTAEREGLTPVAMKDSGFAPKTLTVTEGEDVRIALKNSDPVIHDLHIPDLDLKFTVKPGSEKAFQFVAPEAGTYKFDCSLHPSMKGILEVLAK